MSAAEYKINSACAIAPKSAPELLEAFAYRSRTGNFKQAISRLLERRFLVRTIPEKPRSSKQRYRLTEAGREYLKEIENSGSER